MGNLGEALTSEEIQVRDDMVLTRIYVEASNFISIRGKFAKRDLVRET